MQRLVFSILVGVLAGSPALGESADFPPAAEAGQCFTRVVAPSQAEIVTETIMVRPEIERIELVPAVFVTRTERVLVKEQTVMHRQVPAVYETVTERVMVEPERVEREHVPAEYETYTETIIIEPERTVWKPGTGLFGRAPGAPTDGTQVQATGEVLCRVIKPAVTETVTRTRLVSPPTMREKIVPARYEIVEKDVLVTPARTEVVIIPAEYRDVPIQVMVSEAKRHRVLEPAQYQTVSREVVTGGGEIVWAEVLCETNTTSFKVAEIQGALTDAGYPTLIDGVFGPNTLRAMTAFQADNSLAEGYLTVATVSALGVDPYQQPPDLVYALFGADPPRA